jgi:hypothetical protein
LPCRIPCGGINPTPRGYAGQVVNSVAKRFITVSAVSKERVDAQAAAGVAGEDDFVISEILADVNEDVTTVAA